nr:hypothetical protein [Tanacetum cinerariifolium]
MAEEDRISSLPDHLLLEIISRIKIMDAWKKEERLMSTKEVFQTTTISERRRHLLPTLVFIEEDFMINDEDVLSKGATDLYHDMLPVNSWIHYAITRNVQEIDLRIMSMGELDEDLIGNILSGSPCLETLELNECDVDGRIAKSLFGNFGVLERLSCEIGTYERISDDDELFLDDVNEIADFYARSCLEAKGFQFRKGSDRLPEFFH